VVAGAVSESVLLGLALGIGWLVGVSPFERFRVDFRGLLLGLAATLPMLAALRWCVVTSWTPVRRLVALVVEYLSPYLAAVSPGGIVALSLMAGIVEEAMFRGLVQDGLARHLPEWTAVAIAAALFGAAHWLTPGYALLAGLVGLYLGVLYVLTDNLLVPAVAHAAYDVVALAVLVRMAPGKG
jgi:uncharacterized protein